LSTPLHNYVSDTRDLTATSCYSCHCGLTILTRVKLCPTMGS